ncbi:NAD(P)/FAD-dependent oxidoreductase [Ramlibacter sp. AW1]|uniref:NAD(P)/FAD-dependent oxidoreductase n=1 Tax=Ramlibacter aurantiacus TaxID=2801330 RepID=A0A936ZI91_9BURK|nr:NAD(P)/FAD-dependent oxidoreductase [Ramlibacter aurantiacus]MBL0420718.1 NAD(P)/FAD-dependent oxidoreductase [Ramlibacter aurantiacus]
MSPDRPFPTETRTVDAVVVGAGFAGLYAIHRLRGLGLRVLCIEAAPDVGGTWYWNKYPGARCDVPSLEYSYSFSEELQQEWTWSERFASQPEILRYIRHVAERFDLRRDIVFGTRVTSARFDEARKGWTLATDTGLAVQARFFVAASGCLSAARTPDVPGIANFKGPLYHSGQWPEQAVDLQGLRVGVIGTGSSGIQIIPEVARVARQVVVFQRTPNFSVPARNRPLMQEEQAAFKRDYAQHRARARESNDGMLGLGIPTQPTFSVDEAQRLRTYDARWEHGGAAAVLTPYTDLLTDRAANETLGEFVRGKIRATVRDAEVADKLTPRDHYIGTKRLCQDTGYYDTYNQPHVKLVDIRRSPIEQVTASGITTREGHHELDVLVFATGYDAVTGPLLAMDARGRGGLRLADKWAEGPKAYLGLVTAGFPNLFIVTGPGSPSVKGNMVHSIEQHVNFIADCVAHMQAQDLSLLDADPQAEDRWCEHVREVADRTLFPLADSWYVGANIPGKPRVFLPYVGGIPAYRKTCERVVANGYEGFRLQ